MLSDKVEQEENVSTDFICLVTLPQMWSANHRAAARSYYDIGESKDRIFCVT